MNKPIGIFDSGVGGLTVLKEVKKQMPYENIIYVGDTANAPYGRKDEETLLEYGRNMVKFLLDKNCKAIIIACGTSSSTSYETLKKEFPLVPMIDTINPGVNAAIKFANKNPSSNLCFIATEATIKNGLFSQLFSKKNPHTTLYTKACPLFAPIVEAGIYKSNHPLSKFAVKTYLSDFKGKTSAIVLGCTHYPMLSETIIEVLGDVSLINPAIETAKTAKNILSKNNLICLENNEGEVTYYTSGNPSTFNKTAKIILNKEIFTSKT